MRVRQQCGGLPGSAQPQALRLRKGRAEKASPRPSSAGAKEPNNLMGTGAQAGHGGERRERGKEQ